MFSSYCKNNVNVYQKSWQRFANLKYIISNWLNTILRSSRRILVARRVLIGQLEFYGRGLFNMVFSERRIICAALSWIAMLQASVSCQRAQAININQQLLFSVIMVPRRSWATWNLHRTYFLTTFFLSFKLKHRFSITGDEKFYNFFWRFNLLSRC